MYVYRWKWKSLSWHVDWWDNFSRQKLVETRFHEANFQTKVRMHLHWIIVNNYKKWEEKKNNNRDKGKEREREENKIENNLVGKVLSTCMSTVKVADVRQDNLIIYIGIYIFFYFFNLRVSKWQLCWHVNVNVSRLKLMWDILDNIFFFSLNEEIK